MLNGKIIALFLTIIKPLFSFKIMHSLSFGNMFKDTAFGVSTKSKSTITSRGFGLNAITTKFSFSRDEWLSQSRNHSITLDSLLYPPGSSIKSRMHAVIEHPIYNFLHTYYRYSAGSLKRFSPGMDIMLKDASLHDQDSALSQRWGIACPDGVIYGIELMKDKDKDIVRRNYEVLLLSSMQSPHFGCFGHHEWAMLYSGGQQSTSGRLEPHQALPLRVSQSVIDAVVEASALKCTHFDAFRFFHPQAQPQNFIQLSRSNQAHNEQPACIHATMDLFKYAYQLYPLISADLLRNCLRVAISARIIDMRASPYDVSAFVDDCGPPITVESADGRREYVSEQEKLLKVSEPIRAELLRQYALVVAKLG